MIGMQSRMLQVSRAVLIADCGCHSALRSLISYQIPATAETFELNLLIPYNDTHRLRTLGPFFGGGGGGNDPTQCLAQIRLW
jgi:hypothetical protein